MSTGAPIGGHHELDEDGWARARGFLVGGDNVIVIDSVEDPDDMALALRRGLGQPVAEQIAFATLPIAVRMSWAVIRPLLPVLRAADSAHRPFCFELNPATLPDRQVDLR